MEDSAVWFITGCSSGIGRELMFAARRRGFRVVATARDTAALAGAGTDECLLPLALDVTDRRQIHEAVHQAEARFGRIDVLVNNAGYGYLAAIEEGEDAEVRALFEVNVFGLIDMTRAVLPGMRARRHGHIVNVSSMGGLIGFPGIGYYNATKFAVEGMSEALAREAAPLGIQVTIVEPGPFRTDWAGRSLRVPAVSIDDYDSTAGARRRTISGYSGKQPGDPVRAAEAIVGAVTAEHPPLHLVLGRPAYEQVSEKTKVFMAELEAWKDVSFGADFPIGSQ